MQHFNFSRLINKYSSEVKSIRFKSVYLNEYGEWVKSDAEEIVLRVAIIAIRESKVYRSEGTLSFKDQAVNSLEPIAEELINTTVEYQGDVYRIEESTNNSQFTGVWRYIFKYVSAFKSEVEGGGSS